MPVEPALSKIFRILRDFNKLDLLLTGLAFSKMGISADALGNTTPDLFSDKGCEIDGFNFAIVSVWEMVSFAFTIVLGEANGSITLAMTSGWGTLTTAVPFNKLKSIISNKVQPLSIPNLSEKPLGLSVTIMVKEYSEVRSGGKVKNN